MVNSKRGLVFLMVLFLIAGVSAEFGYNNLEKPTLRKFVTVINETQLNVNNSDFWDLLDTPNDFHDGAFSGRLNVTEEINLGGFGSVIQDSAGQLFLDGTLATTINQISGGDFYVGATGLLYDNSEKEFGVGFSNPNNILSKLHTTINSADGTSNNNGFLTGLIMQQDGSGDAQLSFYFPGTEFWAVGVDNNDGDKFKISNDANFGLDGNEFQLEDGGDLELGGLINATELCIKGIGCIDDWAAVNSTEVPVWSDIDRIRPNNQSLEVEINNTLVMNGNLTSDESTTVAYWEGDAFVIEG